MSSHRRNPTWAVLACLLAACVLETRAQIAPTISVEPLNQTNPPGSNAVFTMVANGTGPFTYQWRFNGTNLPNNIITTLIGNGIATNSGNGGLATNAGLNVPEDAAVDPAGNVYVADLFNDVIRKVDIKGIISTVAGNGIGIYAGDGGLATNASLVAPRRILASGNTLFIGDAIDSRIRAVDTNGIITTIAGNGTNTFAGDGGAATNASLTRAFGMCIDASGNLYFSDLLAQRVRKIDSSGIITTIAGNGSNSFSGDGGLATNASLNRPEGLGFDAAGNLFIADSRNNRIRKIDTNGIITTVAGNGTSNFAGDGGAATNGSFAGPQDVAIDTYENLFIADLGNNRIREVSSNGIITTLAGNGTATYAGDDGPPASASFNVPDSATLDNDGNLLIADQNNQRVRKIFLYAGHPNLNLYRIGVVQIGNYSVVVTSQYGSVTSSIASLTVAGPAAIVTQPASQMAVLGSSPTFSVTAAGSGSFGYLWYFNYTNLLRTGTSNTLNLANISTNNYGNYTVVITNQYGSVTSLVATLTVAFPPSLIVQPGDQTNAAGTAVNLAVTAAGTGPLSYQWLFNGTNLPASFLTLVVGKAPGFSGDGGASVVAAVNQPSGVAADVIGNIYIADQINNRIRKVDTNGIITTIAGNGIGTYAGDGGAATNSSLNEPNATTVDAAGNLYIADLYNQRVRKVDTNGIISTLAGDGNALNSSENVPATKSALNYPTAVAVDAIGGVYIADYNNNRIHRVNTNGIITTVAGNGTSTYQGDGTAATGASIDRPTGIALDASGNLYIADQGNQRIRKVSTNGIITTVAGNGKSGFGGDGGAATNATLNLPAAVAVDAANNLYIADRSNGRVRKVDTNGIISTVAGKPGGTYGNGPSTNALLNAVTGTAVDPAGNVYVADGNSVYKIQFGFGQSTNLTLMYPNLASAGNYSVIVSSPYGSITSAVAKVTVFVSPPQIIASGNQFGFSNNQFGFNLQGTVNQTIIVDGSSNLVNWIPITTYISGGTPIRFTDSMSSTNPWRFYRVRTP